LNRKLIISLTAAGALFAPVLLSPMPRFSQPCSTVVEASDGTLLGARIADDGQWRFPSSEIVPEKFELALLTYEDQWFRFHPGINPVSIIRALSHNMKAGEIVSGGSTITMQVSRLAGNNVHRTYSAKISEMLSALKLELFHSKNDILLMYVSNAPFGGNTVGIEAAARRYTGKSASELSWSETAALAVLPNSPALVYPGKNQELLKQKRDRLLQKLFKRKIIDSLTLVLAVDEPLPGEPKAIPVKAPHLTDYFVIHNKGMTIRTTISAGIQERAMQLLDEHQKTLEENNIFNSACIIIEVKTGNVIAYVGNSSHDITKSHGGDVDLIRARRSTGSILKPFLYAAIQQSGELLPNALVADIPTRFPGFSPENFDKSFSGAVPAGYALSQSLNIPAVKMLQNYNTDRFLELLRKTGFTTFNKTADHYGLSLILGGGETSLWELSGAYASWSGILSEYTSEAKYFKDAWHEPYLVTPGKVKARQEDNAPVFTAAAIWLTYEALQKVNRPESETGWQYFSSSGRMAWKTGTSFGFRDAWAIGTTPDYVIGVWAGNADGEGRPGLTGISAAAPLLFELSGIVKSDKWFDAPANELTKITVCRQSGYKAGPDCSDTEEVDACPAGLKSASCPFHHIIHLDSEKRYQVNSDCYPADKIINESWFVLTPAMEYFYRQKHSGYRILPPFAPGCNNERSVPSMEFIYPSPGVRIFLPRDQEGRQMKLIPEVAHRDPSVKIFWHLDGTYLTTTRYIHHIEVFAGAGDHLLTAVDENGNSIKCGFSIVNPE
jgi:penicillin-binding protein 1C